MLHYSDGNCDEKICISNIPDDMDELKSWFFIWIYPIPREHTENIVMFYLCFISRNHIILSPKFSFREILDFRTWIRLDWKNFVRIGE